MEPQQIDLEAEQIVRARPGERHRVLPRGGTRIRAALRTLAPTAAHPVVIAPGGSLRAT